MRQSAEKGHGRQLSADQLKYLLGAMGRMAFDRQQALAWAESAEFALSAYVAKYGELTQEEIEELGTIEGEIVDNEETTETGPATQGIRVDTPPKEQVTEPIPETTDKD